MTMVMPEVLFYPVQFMSPNQTLRGHVIRAKVIYNKICGATKQKNDCNDAGSAVATLSVITA